MVRLAIAGSGGMAHYHVKKFSALPMCTIVACKDHIQANAQQFAQQHAIEHYYDSLSLMIEQQVADVLSCAVVDWRHADLCKQALEGSLAVFCEKPMTRTLAEAQELKTISEKNNLPTYVNFSKRNADALHALKQLITDSPSEIESVRASYMQGWVANGMWGDWRVLPRWRWRLLPDTGTSGVVGDLGSHVIDALLFLFGGCSIQKITDAIDIRKANQDRLLEIIRPTREFLETEGSYLNVTADALLPYKNQNIPCTIGISNIEKSAVDDFSIVVRFSEAEAVLDLRKSRTSIFLTDYASGKTEKYVGEKHCSTYEHFIRLVEGDYTGTMAVPDFSHGYRVQKILNDLSPGGLPL